MNGFIEIVCRDKCRRLLNVRHIEEVVETKNKDCTIYMAFNTPNAIEQDYFEVAESYEEIINKILKATILNAYVKGV